MSKIVYDDEIDQEPSTEHWRKWKGRIVERVKAAAKLKKTRLNELFSTLLTIDKTLSARKYFKL